MDNLTIRQPDDFHVHLRQLDIIFAYTARVFKRALVMPNVRMPQKPPFRTDIPAPPVRTSKDAMWYFLHITEQRVAQRISFDPLIAIAITDTTTPEIVEEARYAGCFAGKIYPVGMTTNSEHGISDFNAPAFHSALSMMEACGMICCIHAEASESFSLDAEADFIPTLEMIHTRHPRLKMVVEHVTSAAMIQWILAKNEYVTATVTAHHLLLDHDDVVGRRMHPHLHCLPTPKRPSDRSAIQRVVLDGNPKFFFGSDSAPHEIHTKECASACAGVFTAPVALPVLTEFFEEHHALERLEPFVSEFGANFYQIPLNSGTLTLTREPWTVPLNCVSKKPRTDNSPTIVPFHAGETLAWQIAPKTPRTLTL